jgi:hypothetical protein
VVSHRLVFWRTCAGWRFVFEVSHAHRPGRTGPAQAPRYERPNLSTIRCASRAFGMAVDVEEGTRPGKLPAVVPVWIVWPNWAGNTWQAAQLRAPRPGLTERAFGCTICASLHTCLRSDIRSIARLLRQVNRQEYVEQRSSSAPFYEIRERGFFEGTPLVLPGELLHIPIWRGIRWIAAALDR